MKLSSGIVFISAFSVITAAASSETQERQIDLIALESIEKALQKVEKISQETTSESQKDEKIQNLSSIAELLGEKASLLFRLETGKRFKVPKRFQNAETTWKKQEAILTEILKTSDLSPSERWHWVEMRARSCEETQSRACQKRDLWTLVLNSASSHSLSARKSLAALASLEENPSGTLHLIQPITSDPTSSELRGQALHQGAWADFNLGNPLSGFQKLKGALKNFEVAQSRSNQPETLQALIENTASELSLFWLEGRDHASTGEKDLTFSVAGLLQEFERMKLDQNTHAHTRAILRAAKILRTQEDHTALTSLLDLLIQDRKKNLPLSSDVLALLIETAFERKNKSLLEEGLKRIQESPELANSSILSLLSETVSNSQTPPEISELALLALAQNKKLDSEVRAKASFQAAEIAAKQEHYGEAESRYTQSWELTQDEQLKQKSLLSSLFAGTKSQAQATVVSSEWTQRFEIFHQSKHPEESALTALEDWRIEILSQQTSFAPQEHSPTYLKSLAFHRVDSHFPKPSSSKEEILSWSRKAAWLVDALASASEWGPLAHLANDLLARSAGHLALEALPIQEQLLRSLLVSAIQSRDAKITLQAKKWADSELLQKWKPNSLSLATLSLELEILNTTNLESWAERAEIWLRSEMARESHAWKEEDPRVRIQKQVLRIYEDSLLYEKRDELLRLSEKQTGKSLYHSKTSQKENIDSTTRGTVSAYRSLLKKTLVHLEHLKTLAQSPSLPIAEWIFELSQFTVYTQTLQRSLSKIAPIYFHAQSGERWIRWRIEAITELENRLAHRSGVALPPEVLEKILVFQAALQDDAAHELQSARNLPEELKPLIQSLNEKRDLLLQAAKTVAPIDEESKSKLDQVSPITTLTLGGSGLKSTLNSTIIERWNSLWRTARDQDAITDQLKLLDTAQMKGWISIAQYQEQIALILRSHHLEFRAQSILKGVNHAQKNS